MKFGSGACNGQQQWASASLTPIGLTPTHNRSCMSGCAPARSPTHSFFAALQLT